VRVGRPAEVLTGLQLREIHGVEVEVRPLALADGRTVQVCVRVLRPAAP
jgi:hypothetical protein